MIANAAAAQSAGTSSTDVGQFRQLMRTTVNGILAVSALIGAAFYLVIFVGIWRLWRWVYWYVLVVGFLAILAIPQDISYGFGAGGVTIPPLIVVFLVIQAVAYLALSIWLLMLYRRYGTWARRKVPVPG